MKPCHLYALAQVKNMRVYAKYYSALTGEKERVYKPHEAKSLEVLIEELLPLGVDIIHLDNFFYGYIIPQIGKEFDILKITNDLVLNVELKSYVQNLNMVKEQLVKNKFYLAHIDKPQLFFTFNSYDKTLYKLDQNNQLQVASLSELAGIIKGISGAICPLIDDLFSVSQFVLSPTESPQRFLNGEYFLTQQQQQIKKKILQSLQTNKVAKIAGSPGTGKTLLLYELATTLAKNNKVCFLQPGEVLQSQKLIQNAYPNLVFVQLTTELPDLTVYDYVLSDENEIYPDKIYNSLIYQLKNLGVQSILTFEKSDIPVVGEKLKSSVRMSKIRGGVYALSGKIRVNHQIHHFICALFDKEFATNPSFNFESVEIYYSCSKKQTNKFVHYLNQKNFNNILATYDFTCKCEKERNAIPLKVAFGKEYDKVSVVIPNTFFYNQNGKLCDKNTSLFADNLYYAVTRVRKNLCIIIENNSALLDRALTLKS